VPADIVVTAAPGASGATVTYPAVTTTGGVAPIAITCSRSSGAFYPLGVTTVTCTATDSTGDTAADPPSGRRVVSDSFTITVLPRAATTTTTTVRIGTGLPATGGSPNAVLPVAVALILVGAGTLVVTRRR